MINYFIYTRKSTDIEDKQVRSIEDQLSVLQKLVKEENLSVTQEFVEKSQILVWLYNHVRNYFSKNF